MFDNKIENFIVLFILKHSSGVFLQKEIIFIGMLLIGCSIVVKKKIDDVTEYHNFITTYLSRNN